MEILDKSLERLKNHGNRSSLKDVMTDQPKTNSLIRLIKR